MLLFGLVGAVIAGMYGVVHDQVTYTIGPEYFTKFKFEQFHYLSQAQPVRLIVAEIGFLATWWVGFFAGWFMGRVTVPRLPVAQAARLSLVGVIWIMAAALVAGAIAGGLAPSTAGDARLAYWASEFKTLGISDLPAFVRVGYIHNASYLGGLLGLIGSLIWLAKKAN